MDVTPDSMHLSWTVPEGKFDSFVVQYKDRVGQPQVLPVATDHHEITITHLEPNRKYKFLLYGLAGRKRLGPISADGTTGEPSPASNLFQNCLLSKPPELAPLPSPEVYSAVFSLDMTTITPETNIACQALF